MNLSQRRKRFEFVSTKWRLRISIEKIRAIFLDDSTSKSSILEDSQNRASRRRRFSFLIDFVTHQISNRILFIVLDISNRDERSCVCSWLFRFRRIWFSWYHLVRILTWNDRNANDEMSLRRRRSISIEQRKKSNVWINVMRNLIDKLNVLSFSISWSNQHIVTQISFRWRRWTRYRNRDEVV